jgi:hypothetical protein
VIVVLNEDGEEVWTRKIENEPATPAAAIADAGPDPEVVIDARLLADLLRMGMLPEAWIAPAPTREQRELVRYRRKLSQLRAGLKTQARGRSAGVRGVRHFANEAVGAGPLGRAGSVGWLGVSLGLC